MNLPNLSLQIVLIGSSGRESDLPCEGQGISKFCLSDVAPRPTCRGQCDLGGPAAAGQGRAVRSHDKDSDLQAHPESELSVRRREAGRTEQRGRGSGVELGARDGSPHSLVHHSCSQSQ